MNHKIRKLFLIMLSTVSGVQAMNLLRPYDTLIRPQYAASYRDRLVWWQVSLFAEGNVSTKGYNSDGHSVASPNIWECNQDALTMLDGFPVDSEIGKKRIAVDADDDGVRGHFLVNGDLDMQFAGALAVRSFFLRTWSLSAYLPLYVQEFKNSTWCDQTKDITDEDALVKSLLTDNFFENVCELGDLSLESWRRAGVGDLTLLVEWSDDFPQAKPLLRNVRVHGRAGFGIPTGLRQDQDRVLALPFGNDGAFSIPFGMGIDLSFMFHMRLGFNVDLMHTFGNTYCRRIQTAANQTNLLFLEKTDVYKDFGMTQYFSLYAQLYQLWGGESLMLGYEFTKHGQDELSFANDNFSSATANTAAYLQEWTLHQCIVRADYDFAKHMPDDAFLNPRISLYARIPFNGKRVIANTMLGATFAIDF